MPTILPGQRLNRVIFHRRRRKTGREPSLASIASGTVDSKMYHTAANVRAQMLMEARRHSGERASVLVWRTVAGLMNGIPRRNYARVGRF